MMQMGSKQDSTSLPVKEPREPDRSWPRGYVHVHVWECVRGSVCLLVSCTSCVCAPSLVVRARDAYPRAHPLPVYSTEDKPYAPPAAPRMDNRSNQAPDVGYTGNDYKGSSGSAHLPRRDGPQVADGGNHESMQLREALVPPMTAVEAPAQTASGERVAADNGPGQTSPVKTPGCRCVIS